MKKHGSINLVYKFAGIFSLCILTSGFATAGTRDGGGGIGVRCNAPGKGSTLELLDLHETRQKGIAISYQPTSKEEAIAFTTALITTTPCLL